MDPLELAKRHFLDGVAFFEAKDFSSAELRFRQALGLVPDRVSVLTNLAATLVKNGGVAEAKAMATKAVGIDPKAVDSWIVLGICCHEHADYGEAVAAYDRAVAINPRQVEAWTNRGTALHQLKRHDEAQLSFQKALAIDPRHLAAWCNRGLALEELKRHDEALACYDKAIAISPNDFQAVCSRADLCHRLKRYQEALTSYETALSLKPDHADTWLKKGMALHALKRHEEALSAISRALDLKPSLALAWQARGNILQDLKSYGEALACYDRAISIDAGMVDAWAARASLYILDLGGAERALEESTKSLKVFLDTQFNAFLDHPADCTLLKKGVSRLRLKHEWEQAQYLLSRSYEPRGLKDFLQVAGHLMTSTDGEVIAVKMDELAAMLPYLGTYLLFEMPEVRDCLNPDKDWKEIEQTYLSRKPEVVIIDDFLSPEALAAFREHCHVSRVWMKEYGNKYVGAFANRGFTSHLHLRLAKELKQAMPRVFRDLQLTQLWAFKYDSRVTQGTNAHADFAEVNLNFWITPDEHNLDQDAGGLRVYDIPSPRDWPFVDYNENTRRIYDFLQSNNAKCTIVPHRSNRALLFNSALFHETDRIHFKDGYESRRINLTYLFGAQL